MSGIGRCFASLLALTVLLLQDSSQPGNRHLADERGASRDHRVGSGSGIGSATSSGSKDKDGDPSEALWVGFPLYAKVDEDTWDLPEEDVLSRDQKRPRIGGMYSVNPSGETVAFDSFDGRRFLGVEGANVVPSPDAGNGNYGGARQPLLGDDYTGQGSRGCLQPHFDGARPLGLISHSPVGQIGGFHAGKRDALGQEPGTISVNESWRWHGTIAKGGTPVCRARCLPVGKGIDVHVPDVVNCTARTDLDMLARHVYQAGDFGVVFFVPESDPDVPPYQDFMHYLGEKHRAGVAKLNDGTTLFLVPPSEFSERVLKVPGNDCLFGVVLKQPPVIFSQTQQASQQHQQHASGLQPLQLAMHSQFSQTVGPAVINVPSQDPPGFRGPSPPLLQGQQSGQSSLSSATGHAQLSQVQLANLAGQNLAGHFPTGLTPELIASLTALLPQQTTSVNSLAAGPSVSGQFTQGGAAVGRATAGLATSNSGVVDVLPAFRSPQASPLQGWHHFQQEQNQAAPPGGGLNIYPTGVKSMSEQVPMLHSGPSQQQQPPQPQATQSQLPQKSSPPQQPGVSLSSTRAILPSVQSQACPPSGFHGNQPHARPGQPSAAPQLPAEQLAQLTALLTQRQQQPAQQQAAHLLHQHFQQQHPESVNASIPPLSSQTQGVSQVQSQQLLTSQPLQPSLVSVTQASWDKHHQQTPAAQQQAPQGLQPWEGTVSQSSETPVEQPAVSSQVPSGDGEADRQKRFQATLELAAALLQQMQQQDKPRG